MIFEKQIILTKSPDHRIHLGQVGYTFHQKLSFGECPTNGNIFLVPTNSYARLRNLVYKKKSRN